jgi:protein gp37
MSGKTNIQWTDATWNIARGCSKVDEDCRNCYMYRESLQATRYNPKQVNRTKSVFDFPLKYKETQSQVWPGKPLIFTSSLTDVFHEDIDAYRDEMWDIIRRTDFIYQVLTKRPERIPEHLPVFWDDIKHRVWLGTSVGGAKGLQRIRDLAKLRDKCNVLFLSVEPYHTPFDIEEFISPCGYYCAHSPEDFDEYSQSDEFLQLHPDYKAVEAAMFYNKHHKPDRSLFDWVIIGGESGNKNKYRPCKLEWIHDMAAKCVTVGVPVFIKQLGTHLANELKLHDRHGGDINEFPEYLRIRQFPNYTT